MCGTGRVLEHHAEIALVRVACGDGRAIRKISPAVGDSTRPASSAWWSCPSRRGPAARENSPLWISRFRSRTTEGIAGLDCTPANWTSAWGHGCSPRLQSSGGLRCRQRTLPGSVQTFIQNRVAGSKGNQNAHHVGIGARTAGSGRLAGLPAQALGQVGVGLVGVTVLHSSIATMEPTPRTSLIWRCCAGASNAATAMTRWAPARGCCSRFPFERVQHRASAEAQASRLPRRCRQTAGGGCIHDPAGRIRPTGHAAGQRLGHGMSTRATPLFARQEGAGAPAPVCTSSAIRTMPCWSHRARRR